MTFATRFWSPLLRAGAFGALHGAHPGDPAVGLSVPLRAEADLDAAQAALGQTRATLLVPPALARTAPEALAAAARAGHELAGTGPDLTQAALLDTLSGQPVAHWALDPADLSGAALRGVAARGLRLLPTLPARPPMPGALLRAEVAELPALLTDLGRGGYRPGPVRELPELRQGQPHDLFLAAYQRVVEDRYAEREGIIDLSGRFDGVMRVAPLDHAPPPLPLPRTAPTAELHLNSGRLVGLATRSKLGTYRAYQRSLKDVAQAMQSRPELAQAQAVFAVTLFHGPLEKSGFALLDLPPAQARWYGLGFRLLRLAYGTAQASSDGTPRMAWMERGAFLERYGS